MESTTCIVHPPHRTAEWTRHWEAAAAVLQQAFQAAEDNRCNIWQFAVEMEQLLAAGVNVSELRRWVMEGRLLHRVEYIRPGALDRTFRRVFNLSFPRGTCFVLSEPEAETRWPVPCASESPGFRPDWLRGERDRGRVPRWSESEGKLWWGETVVREYRHLESEQECILTAFEEEHWLFRIGNPLPDQHWIEDPREHLRQVLRNLNRSILDRLLRFWVSHDREGIHWQGRLRS